MNQVVNTRKESGHVALHLKLGASVRGSEAGVGAGMEGRSFPE